MRESRPPFPGMDPWLEQPAFWPDLHNRLIVAIADALTPLVDPDYFVRIETRTTVLALGAVERVMRPDLVIGSRRSEHALGAVAVVETDVEVLDVEIPITDEIEESYLEIRDVETRSLVSILEVLSPTNKIAAEGRRDYLAKRERILHSRTSLIEIDLLRAGRPMPSQPAAPEGVYHILVSRGHTRPRAKLSIFTYRDPIPPLPIPLLPDVPEPILDLNAVMRGLIERARYFRTLDYSRPPTPPLPAADETWAAAILAEGDVKP